MIPLMAEIHFRYITRTSCVRETVQVWLRKASPAVFKFVYEKVTLVMTTLSGLLLISGSDLKALIRMVVPL